MEGERTNYQTQQRIKRFGKAGFVVKKKKNRGVFKGPEKGWGVFPDKKAKKCPIFEVKRKKKVPVLKAKTQLKSAGCLGISKKSHA